MPMIWEFDPSVERAQSDPFHGLSFPVREAKNFLFLKRQAERALRSRGLAASFIVPSMNDFRWDGKGTADVLLFSDAPQLLLNPWIWPRKGNFRLWVLSRSSREVCSGLLGIGEKFVGVIPRSSLVGTRVAERPFPDIRSPFTAVISSRFDFGKNVPLTLSVLCSLQRSVATEMRVAIASPDPMHPHIKEFFSQLPWKQKPRFLGDAGTHWVKRFSKAENPVYFNLSTLRGEDFSVAAAEAQSAGWPLVLTSWSVFREISGRNVLHLPAKQIVNEAALSPGLVLELTEALINQWEDRKTPKPKREKWVIPRALTFDELAAQVGNRTSRRRRSVRQAYAPSHPKQRQGRLIDRILSREL